MTQFNNDGKVSIWEGESTSPKAPKYKGKVYAHRDIAKGEELEISLWDNESEHPKAPLMRGKIGDKFKPQGQSQGSGNAGYKEPF